MHDWSSVIVGVAKMTCFLERNQALDFRFFLPEGFVALVSLFRI